MREAAVGEGDGVGSRGARDGQWRLWIGKAGGCACGWRRKSRSWSERSGWVDGDSEVGGGWIGRDPEEGSGGGR